MYRLTIHLKTPACVGSGVTGSGAVDRDVVFDDVGLPFIPGRRIKGLLREGFRDINIALGYSAEAEDYLFGQIGASRSGVLRIGSASLYFEGESDGSGSAGGAHPSLSEWLSSARDIIHHDEVLDAFTELRRQTAIDPKTGVARQETLRATRVLSAGLQFRAEIGSPIDLPGELEHLLGCAAAAVQNLGTSRSRGLGQVECKLNRDDLHLTRIGLDALQRERIQAPDLHPSAESARDKLAAPPLEAGKRARLRYRITLTEPALFAGLDGDPNLVATYSYVPGSTVQGLLATRYLEKYAEGDGFYQLFCRDRVRFLTAHPEGAQGDMLHPIPLSFRSRKGDETTCRNQIFQNGDSPSGTSEADSDREFTERLSGKWTALARAYGGDDLLSHEVDTAFAYHHARPSDDRRVGHAVGQDQATLYGLRAAGSGAVFTYEHLKAGQSFQGSLVGDLECLKMLQGLIASKADRVLLGRSKAGQYGGEAVFEWLDKAPGPVTESSQSASAADSAELCAMVAVTLLTPLISYDPEKGHPIAELPITEIEHATKLRFSHGIARAFTRTSWCGGYVTHQRLPRQQMPALEAGSVFVLNLDAPVSVAEIDRASAALAAHAFGLRTAQGFGILRIDPLSRLPYECSVAQDIAELPSVSPVKSDSEAGKLALRIWKRRLEKAALSEAVELAERTKLIDSGKPLLSKSLLNRLRESVTVTSFEALGRALEKYPKPARAQMERCLVRRLPFEEKRVEQPYTLDEFLLHVSTEYAKYFRGIAARTYESEKWDQVFGKQNPLLSDPDSSEMFMRRLLEQYIKTLLWKLRKFKRST